MIITPSVEVITIDSKGEAEIKYHAASGIDEIVEVSSINEISKQIGVYNTSKINKDEYKYLDYLPVIRFSKKYIGKKILVKYNVERFTSQTRIYIDSNNDVMNLSNFKDKEYSFISFNKSGGIRKSKFKDQISGTIYNKPGGGLWASMYTPEKKYISAWQLYIDSHRKEGISSKKPSRCVVLFNLKDGSKIPVIDSWEDYMKLSNAFSYKKVFERIGEPLPDDIPGDLIDYELMAQIYDGIYVTKNGILDAGDTYWNDTWWNMVHRHEKDENLRMFSCESLCLFNLDCIVDKKNIKLEKW